MQTATTARCGGPPSTRRAEWPAPRHRDGLVFCHRPEAVVGEERLADQRAGGGAEQPADQHTQVAAPESRFRAIQVVGLGSVPRTGPTRRRASPFALRIAGCMPAVAGLLCKDIPSGGPMVSRAAAREVTAHPSQSAAAARSIRSRSFRRLRAAPTRISPGAVAFLDQQRNRPRRVERRAEPERVTWPGKPGSDIELAHGRFGALTIRGIRAEQLCKPLGANIAGRVHVGDTSTALHDAGGGARRKWGAAHAGAGAGGRFPAHDGIVRRSAS